MTHDGVLKGLNWSDKTLLADTIYEQVNALLSATGEELHQTPRRPDVRMILQNTTGKTAEFYNPGNHSGDNTEKVPGTGEKTAAMMMLKGDTLEEQYQNAQTLMERFNMATEGLSEELLRNMAKPTVLKLIDELYGPAPYADQVSKFEPLSWLANNGQESKIHPVFGKAASFGARPATMETVFLAKVPIYVQGTGTVAELLEADGMCIAVSKHWQTGEVSTRPIVPSVAKTYYGAHFDSMPVVTVHPEHGVSMINMRNGSDPIRHVNYRPSGAKVEGAQPKLN